tara:strand:- start:4708 stop:4902 length:195 start_codon:yes stop_codon:yes gene_type:complete
MILVHCGSAINSPGAKFNQPFCHSTRSVGAWQAFIGIAVCVLPVEAGLDGRFLLEFSAKLPRHP